MAIDMSIDPLFVMEDEYLSGSYKAQEGQEVFVRGNDGKMFRLGDFYDGRKVLLPVSTTGGFKASQLKFNIREFLPEKLPLSMYHQVESFFRAVMAKPSTKGAEAYVQLWRNPQGEYFLHVPKQTVSGGAVHAKMDPEDAAKLMTEGHTVIGDIHSHNTMSAFFSSIDDADDANKIGIAGVIGNITETGAKSMWRFCYGGTGAFINLSFDDVFEVPSATAFPEEWLDKVSGTEVAVGYNTRYGPNYDRFADRSQGAARTTDYYTGRKHVKNIKEIYKHSSFDM